MFSLLTAVSVKCCRGRSRGIR